MRHVFEYATLRAVPRPERGEFINIGVIVYCGPLDFLGAKVRVDPARLLALDPGADPELVDAHARSMRTACVGGADAGSVGEISLGQRFRWLTAPRSTVIQASPTHTGLTDDPRRELDHLFRVLVLPVPTA